MVRGKLCNVCVFKTRAGRACKRRTCKTTNLPYCWQHLPQAQKGKPLKTRLQSALHSAKPENRAELHEHMVRVFGGTEEEKEIIGHQLTSVYARNSNWQLRYYRDPKTTDIVAHVIVRPARPASRLAREEFEGSKLLNKHVTQNMLYVDSVGTESRFRRRGLASVMMRSFSVPLILQCEPKHTRTYSRIGFKKVPELTLPDRACMIRK
jgi:hypothetical protein